VSWWGTVPDATVPTASVALFWAMSPGAWCVRLHAGLRTDSYWAWAYYSTIFDLGLAVAGVVPLREGWGLVLEGELLWGPSPGHVRVLARRPLPEAWTLDFGVAMPIPALWRDPTAQLLVQLDRRF